MNAFVLPVVIIVVFLAVVITAILARGQRHYQEEAPQSFPQSKREYSTPALREKMIERQPQAKREPRSMPSPSRTEKGEPL